MAERVSFSYAEYRVGFMPTGTDINHYKSGATPCQMISLIDRECWARSNGYAALGLNLRLRVGKINCPQNPDSEKNDKSATIACE